MCNREKYKYSSSYLPYWKADRSETEIPLSGGYRISGVYPPLADCQGFAVNPAKAGLHPWRLGSAAS